MAYVGNTPTTQAFTSAIDYFSGNGSTTSFTLSRPVASVAQVEVTVNNVPQNPSTAFTVSGNTLTFTGTPSSGTNNIYVQYTSPVTQTVQPGTGTVGTAQIQDGAVVTQDIAANAVTPAKMSRTGTAGQVLTSNGAGADPSYTSISSLPGSQGQVFTSNGTFTIPSGITAVKVTVVGGGGGGGSSYENGAGYSNGAAGGGGGGAAISYLTSLTPGNTLTVTVGGAGATSSVASGTQSISTISATGGATGGSSSNGSGGVGGAGGVGSGGSINLYGSSGGSAYNVAFSGNGGSSIFGGGAAGVLQGYGNGSAGRVYGGGGSGGCIQQAATGSVAGGAGAAGVVIFEW